MASINIRKLHGGEAAAILAHNHRHDGREGVEYRNEHIDPARTHLNSVLMPRGVGRETAAQELARLRARVAAIDAAEPPKRIRKDRVTLVSVEIPAPAGLPPEQEKKFFKEAAAEVAKFCGGIQNCGSIRIHRDEVHDYLDPVTRERRTSRVHAHMLCIPYMPGRGVNCKSFMSRERLREIQKAIDARCRRVLGIPFLDGSRQKSRGTVEDLKIATARAEREEQYLSQLRQSCQDAQEEMMSLQQSLMSLQEMTDALRAEAAELRDALPIVRQVAHAVEILDEIDENLSNYFRQELAAGGIHPDDPRDQARLRKAAETISRASRRHSRHFNRNQDIGFDR